MPLKYKPSPLWPQIRARILERAGEFCELCFARRYHPHWKTSSKVILTVHHINGNHDDQRDCNLLALCQRCHLRLEAPGRYPQRTLAI
jgi:5-methylcytosine-specific restriction endonuclease McrA